MIKKIFTIFGGCLIFAVTTTIQAQESHTKTELCIVGTMHDERSYINSDSIYNILFKLKPDLILIELDSSFFTKDFRFDLKKRPDLLSTNEFIGAEKYYSQHNVDLRPFEITGRNEYYMKTNFFENEKKMIEDIHKLYKNNMLSKKDKEDFELILFGLEVGNTATFHSVQELNSDLSMKFWLMRQKILYPKIVSIVENEQELHHWIDFAKEWEAFWHIRNAVMADNIRKFASEYKNKRIVVLVGNDHKPCLLDLLLPYDSQDFIIREYWTYQ